jgi:hypothetical protein
MCSYDRARARGEGLASLRILIFVLLVPLLVTSFGLLALQPEIRAPGLRQALVVGLCVTAVLVVVACLATRRGFPGDLFAKALRDNHEGKMRDKALDLADQGKVINRHRLHWFATTPEGFTEITELDGWVSAQGIIDYEYCETGGPWSLVLEVLSAEEHIFLIGRDEVVWIIPKRCFADEPAAQRFVEMVEANRRATARPPEAIVAALPREVGVPQP